MEEKKRKGYKTQEQQTEANKRWLANNPDAKLKMRRSKAKSECKKFIREYATSEELEEIKILISEKEKEL